jgi:hypothetical protein
MVSAIGKISRFVDPEADSVLIAFVDYLRTLQTRGINDGEAAKAHYLDQRM